jgi:hypothetical protein
MGQRPFNLYELVFYYSKGMLPISLMHERIQLHGSLKTPLMVIYHDLQHYDAGVRDPLLAQALQLIGQAILPYVRLKDERLSNLEKNQLKITYFSMVHEFLPHSTDFRFSNHKIKLRKEIFQPGRSFFHRGGSIYFHPTSDQDQGFFLGDIYGNSVLDCYEYHLEKSIWNYLWDSISEDDFYFEYVLMAHNMLLLQEPKWSKNNFLNNESKNCVELKVTLRDSFFLGMNNMRRICMEQFAQKPLI